MKAGVKSKMIQVKGINPQGKKRIGDEAKDNCRSRKWKELEVQ